MPDSDEIDYLTKLGFDKKSFITPGVPLKIVGYTFKIGTFLRTNANYSLGEISDSLIKRVAHGQLCLNHLRGENYLQTHCWSPRATTSCP